MDFYRRYELIDPLPGQGTKSFRGRQVATAREVTVHLLVGGRTPENEQLLARLRAMPAQSFSKLIEVGDNDGTPYVVTMAPPYQHLGDWLNDQEKAAAQNVPRSTHAGAWRAPVSPSESVTPPGAAPAAPPAARATLSQAPAMQDPPAPASPLASPAKPAPQPSVPPPASGPGEFTLVFQRSGIPIQEPAKSATGALPPAKPAPQPGTPAASEPGEFTRIFQAAGRTDLEPSKSPQPVAAPTSSSAPPAKPAAPPSATGALPAQPPPPTGTPAASGPGEFTRVFQAAGRSDPEPPRQPQPAATPASFNSPPARPVAPPSATGALPSQPNIPASEPGEFTRLFQTGARPTGQQPVAPQQPASASFFSPEAKPAAPSTVPVTSPPGEFAHMFEDSPKSPIAEPAPPPAPPPSRGPGEFTQMFNSPLPERPEAQGDWPQQPAKLTEAGTFKRMVPSPPVAASRSDEAPQGGEFTRFFKAPAAGTPPGPQEPPGSGLFPASPVDPTPQQPLPQQRSPQPPRSSQPGEFTRMFGRPGQDPGAVPSPQSAGNPSGGATGAFLAPALQPAGPSGGGSYGAPLGTPASPPPVTPPAEPQGPSEYTMMIGRPQNLQGGAPGGGSPSAPPVQQSGGSPIQVNVQSPQMPYVQTPYVQTPQLPYVPQPQVQLPGGGYVQGPRIPQPYIPQPVIPQPTIPQASVTATGSSTNWLLIAIVALVALLVGVALGMFLKK